MRWLRPIARRFAAGMVVAACFAAAWAQPALDALLHKPAPQFVRADLSGRSIDLSAYKGQVVLLTFWATWCAPCQIEMPHFMQWQKDYSGQGFQIIAVSMDDDAAPVRTLVRKRALNYPVVMGDEELGTKYGGVLGLPVTFLIDRDGNVTAKFQGEGKLDAMQREVLRLLKNR